MSLKYAILAAVSGKPQTGYDLSRQIDGSIGYFWNATHQQIYKELGELEHQGFLGSKTVKQREKPDKKVYQISRLGLAELKKWIALEADLPPAKDALLIKLFAAHLVEPTVILDVLEKQYKQRELRLKKYLDIESKSFKGKKLSVEMGFQYLTIKRGIVFERAWMEWADLALSFTRGRAKG